MATTGDFLAPGTAQYPGTGVYPGQGAFPLYRFYIAYETLVVAPNWVDKSSALLSWGLQSGRVSELEDFDSARVTVALTNRDRYFDPQINGSIKPMNRVKILSEFSGEVNEKFTGYAERWRQNWPQPGTSDAIATVEAVDEYKVLNLASLPTSGTISGNTTTGAQINQILDLIGSQTPRRIDVGAFLNSADARNLAGQSPKSEIDISNSIDYQVFIGNGQLSASAWFIAGSGTIVYLQGDHRLFGASRYTTPRGIFGDAAGELPYVDVEPELADTFIRNIIQITPLSGSDEVRSDLTSRITYGTRVLQKTLPAISAECGFLADRLLAKYKDPINRINQLEPIMGDPEACRVTLSLDLMDCIRVKRTPPGGGARFDQTTWVQGQSIQCEIGKFPSVKLNVSPL